MPGDLPDYTRLITVNVEIPEVQIGAVNVGRYAVSPADLPDGTRTPVLTDIKGHLIVVQYQKDRTVETAAGKYVRVKGHASDEVPVTLTDQEIIPRPKGGVLAKGSVTTTGTYQNVATRTVTNLKTFQLAKILVSCPEDIMFQLVWDGSAISAEVYVSGKIPFVDWFPWNYKEMLGDGAKAFAVQAKYPSGGTAGTCHAEIVGEEA